MLLLVYSVQAHAVRRPYVMASSMEQLALSARAFHRVLKVARTVADLAEAIQYRRRGQG